MFKFIFTLFDLNYFLRPLKAARLTFITKFLKMYSLKSLKKAVLQSITILLDMRMLTFDALLSAQTHSKQTYMLIDDLFGNIP